MSRVVAGGMAELSRVVHSGLLRVSARWVLASWASLLLAYLPGAAAATHERDAESRPKSARDIGVPAHVAESAPVRFMTEEAAVARVLELADQRLALMPAVAAVKWQTHAPIFDAPREGAVIQRARELAEPMGLEGEPVGRLFQLQANLAKEVQSGLHERWRAQGFDYPGEVKSLAELRPRLDTLTHEMLQALYLVTPFAQQAGFATRYASLAERQLNTAGWSDRHRAEFLEALQDLREKPVAPLQRIATSGLLRVGTTGDYAPFSLESNGTLSGSDIELARELAGRLHAQPVFVRTSWKSLLDDLDKGDFDLGLGGVSVTPAREARAAFSTAYVSGGKTIVARCSDAAKYSGLAKIDRPRVRVIVNPGGTNEEYVRAHVHRAKIVVYPDNRTIFDEIGADHADVMITDDVEAELQARHHPTLCRAYPGTLTHADKAILLPRDPDLIKAVNEWLAAALAAGRPARLLESYLNR